MISTETNLKTVIDKIDEEINKYANFSRIELFEYCIQELLKEKLRLYSDEIDNTVQFLESRGSARVLKALAKIQKKEDKEIIEANLKKEVKEEN